MTTNPQRSEPGSGAVPVAAPSASATTGRADAASAARDRLAQAAEAPEMSLIAEFLLFLRENKAWWMVPILLALLLLGAVAWLSSTAAAPFIYPLF